jgi:hypothetical protein
MKLGGVSAVEWRTIWIADAHRDDGKRFVARAGEKADRVSGTGIGDLVPENRCDYQLSSVHPPRIIPKFNKLRSIARSVLAAYSPRQAP